MWIRNHSCHLFILNEFVFWKQSPSSQKWEWKTSKAFVVYHFLSSKMNSLNGDDCINLCCSRSKFWTTHQKVVIDQDQSWPSESLSFGIVSCSSTLPPPPQPNAIFLTILYDKRPSKILRIKSEIRRFLSHTERGD